VMPRELHDVLDPYLKKLEQELDPTKKPAEGESQSGSSHAQQGTAAPSAGLRRLPPTGNEWRGSSEPTVISTPAYREATRNQNTSFPGRF